MIQLLDGSSPAALWSQCPDNTSHNDSSSRLGNAPGHSTGRREYGLSPYGGSTPFCSYIDQAASCLVGFLQQPGHGYGCAFALAPLASLTAQIRCENGIFCDLTMVPTQRCLRVHNSTWVDSSLVGKWNKDSVRRSTPSLQLHGHRARSPRRPGHCDGFSSGCETCSYSLCPG